MMPTVLAVDDSKEIHPFLKTALSQTCSLLLASTLKEAEEILSKNEIHLILLDVSLPDGSGFDFCTTLQSQDSTQKIPVIFLTGKIGVGDKVLGLALGAEDYVTKPFDVLELRARVESKLKKFLYYAKEETYFQRGSLKFELSTYSIYLNENNANQKLNMTPIEFKLLLKLARSPGYVLSREQLIDSVWGDSVYIEDRSVDRHISSIRKKLGTCSSYIRTVPGLGYQFLGRAATLGYSRKQGVFMESQFDAVQSLKSIESNYGPQIAREVVQIFITDYPGKIEKLKAAITEGKPEIIRFVAHDIKSGCLSMGIQPMSSLCEKIEREGAQMPKEELSELTAQLQDQYQQISKDYGNYLNMKH